MNNPFHAVYNPVTQGVDHIAFTPQEEADFLAAEAAARPPVPETISDRQFAQGLAHQGLISQTEALDWVRTGALPAAVSAFLTGLPPATRFDTEMILSGATEFRRSHPLVSAVGAQAGKTETEIDELWRFCATL